MSNNPAKQDCQATKICPHCGISKPADYDHFRPNEGYISWCRDCERQYQKDRRLGIITVEPNYCHHCGELIPPRPGKPKYHLDRPDCYKAHLDHQRVLRKESQRRIRERDRQGIPRKKTQWWELNRHCNTCGTRLWKPWRFNCPKCLWWIENDVGYRLDGNHIYASLEW